MPRERPFRTAVPRPERPKSPGTRRPGTGAWRLLLLQSLSCIAVLAMVILLKYIAGGWFAQLKVQFDGLMRDNLFSSVLSGLFPDEETPSSSTPNHPASSDSSGTSPDSSAGAPSGGSTFVEEGEDLFDAGEDDGLLKVSYTPAGATFTKLVLGKQPAAPLPSGHFTSFFGYREYNGRTFHRGVDIGEVAGTPIAAMFDGIVTKTGVSSTYGNYIILDHGNGIEILYAHCHVVLAKQGETVKAGETVAKVGNTGDSTGSHLHIELRIDGVHYDPLDLLPEALYA